MLHVDIVTTERQALSEDVDFIAAPTPKGEIGILPNHTPLVTELSLGQIRFKKGTETKVLAVTGGFLEVEQGSKVSIFAEAAEFAHEIDVERARMAAERAKSKLTAGPSADMTDEELVKVDAALKRAILRIKIAERGWRKPPPDGPHNEGLG